jgi:hypothetical protein
MAAIEWWWWNEHASGAEVRGWRTRRGFPRAAAQLTLQWHDLVSLHGNPIAMNCTARHLSALTNEAA